MAKRLLITGNVQGVGYRWYTRGLAEGFQLKGWVRNKSDGRVEIVVDALPDAFLDRLKAFEGVDDVAVAEFSPDEKLEDFKIRF